MEYTGIIGIVAVLLVLGVAVVNAGGITNAVIREFKHALCVVTGEACVTPPPKPCAIRTTEKSLKVGVKAAIVKLGGKGTVILTELSDGSVDVALLEEGRAGATLGAGVKAKVDLGKGSTGFGDRLSGELLQRLALKQLWHTKDRHAADDLVEDLAKKLAVDTGTHAIPVVGGLLNTGAKKLGLVDTHIPKPDVLSVENGREGSLKAELGGGEAELSAGVTLGASVDRKTGDMTYTFALDGDLGGTLGGAIGVTGGGAGTLTYVKDAQGRPKSLAVALQGRVIGGLTLPGRPKAKPGDKLQVTSTLDLSVPGSENRAAADRVLRALTLKGVRDLPSAVTDLGRRLVADGAYDLARYDTSEVAYGAEGELALGGRLGGELTVSSLRGTLVDAWTKPAGGVWEPRLDCLKALS